MANFKPFSENHLDAYLELFNKNMDYDSINETLLREKIVDDSDFNAELNFSLWHDEELLGFLSGLVREINKDKTAYVKLMVVAKSHRREGLGQKLYQAFEQKIREMNVSLIRVYDVPFNYFMPGIDPRYTEALSFFETLGFERFADTSNLVVQLQNQDFNTEQDENHLSKKQIAISRAGYEDMQDVFAFIDEYFPLWRSEVSNAYNSLPVSLHIARQDGQLKAFSAHNGNNFGTGWFGPMGTHPDLRGLGIGGILLKRCLQDMKDWELETSVIPWVGPIRFYSYYANARVDRIFWRYQKKLQ